MVIETNQKEGDEKRGQLRKLTPIIFAMGHDIKMA